MHSFLLSLALLQPRLVGTQAVSPVSTIHAAGSTSRLPGSFIISLSCARDALFTSLQQQGMAFCETILRSPCETTSTPTQWVSYGNDELSSHCECVLTEFEETATSMPTLMTGGASSNGSYTWASAGTASTAMHGQPGGGVSGVGPNMTRSTLLHPTVAGSVTLTSTGNRTAGGRTSTASNITSPVSATRNFTARSSSTVNGTSLPTGSVGITGSQNMSLTQSSASRPGGQTLSTAALNSTVAAHSDSRAPWWPSQQTANSSRLHSSVSVFLSGSGLVTVTITDTRQGNSTSLVVPPGSSPGAVSTDLISGSTSLTNGTNLTASGQSSLFSSVRRTGGQTSWRVNATGTETGTTVSVGLPPASPQSSMLGNVTLHTRPTSPGSEPSPSSAANGVTGSQATTAPWGPGGVNVTSSGLVPGTFSRLPPITPSVSWEGNSTSSHNGSGTVSRSLGGVVPQASSGTEVGSRSMFRNSTTSGMGFSSRLPTLTQSSGRITTNNGGSWRTIAPDSASSAVLITATGGGISGITGNSTWSWNSTASRILSSLTSGSGLSASSSGQTVSEATITSSQNRSSTITTPKPTVSEPSHQNGTIGSGLRPSGNSTVSRSLTQLSPSSPDHSNAGHTIVSYSSARTGQSPGSYNHSATSWSGSKSHDQTITKISFSLSPTIGDHNETVHWTFSGLTRSPGSSTVSHGGHGSNTTNSTNSPTAGSTAETASVTGSGFESGTSSGAINATAPTAGATALPHVSVTTSGGQVITNGLSMPPGGWSISPTGSPAGGGTKSRTLSTRATSHWTRADSISPAGTPRPTISSTYSWSTNSSATTPLSAANFTSVTLSAYAAQSTCCRLPVDPQGDPTRRAILRNAKLREENATIPYPYVESVEFDSDGVDPLWLTLRGTDGDTHYLDVFNKSRISMIDIKGNSIAVDGQGLHFATNTCAYDVSITIGDMYRQLSSLSHKECSSGNLKLAKRLEDLRFNQTLYMQDQCGSPVGQSIRPYPRLRVGQTECTAVHVDEKTGQWDFDCTFPGDESSTMRCQFAVQNDVLDFLFTDSFGGGCIDISTIITTLDRSGQDIISDATFRNGLKSQITNMTQTAEVEEVVGEYQELWSTLTEVFSPNGTASTSNASATSPLQGYVGVYNSYRSFIQDVCEDLHLSEIPLKLALSVGSTTISAITTLNWAPEQSRIYNITVQDPSEVACCSPGSVASPSAPNSTCSYPEDSIIKDTSCICGRTVDNRSVAFQSTECDNFVASCKLDEDCAAAGFGEFVCLTGSCCGKGVCIDPYACVQNGTDLVQFDPESTGWEALERKEVMQL